MPTIATLLQRATKQLAGNSDSARLDTELLLSHCIEKPREYLYTWPEAEITAAQESKFTQLLKRRLQGEPLAYLTGEKEFWSHTVKVTPDTLIPRPDTELMVELVLNKLDGTDGPFLDLGTGSGAIAICVAKELPDIDVVAVEYSAAAMAVAFENAQALNARVRFVESNWFENLPAQTFAVIATNPPYIAADDPHLTQGGLPFEPIEALRSCDNGFADITAIIKESPEYLQSNGWLLIEHGYQQGQRTRELMLENHFSQVETIKDLANNDRVTLGQKA